MMMRLALLALSAAGGVLAADWSPRVAADYLDARQKEWFAWPPASTATGAPCVSCHTGATYLLARPALRRALGEKQPTEFESGFLANMRARVNKNTAQDLYPKSKDPSHAAGVETILSALFLAAQDAGGPMGPATRLAFERLWALQIRDGKAKGSWAWFELNLDPWETDGDAPFFGAALAAVAAGMTPREYREQPEVHERVNDLALWLRRQQEAQPLHNRLAALWASANLPEVLPDPARQLILAEVWNGQQEDGGWTNESLGPWKNRPEAPLALGSSGYATAFVAFTLQRAGVKPSDARLKRALAWLRARQDRKGFWPADSMNKRYPEGSMQQAFMRDAATAFAVLALLETPGA